MDKILRYRYAGSGMALGDNDTGSDCVMYQDHLAAIAEKDVVIKKLAKELKSLCGCSVCFLGDDGECDIVKFLRSLGVEAPDA